MDPDLAPDPAVFGLQDANKKTIFLSFFAYYHFSKIHLHNFSKIKSHEEVTKQ
jgi:hypothetical protein